MRSTSLSAVTVYINLQPRGRSYFQKIIDAIFLDILLRKKSFWELYAGKSVLFQVLYGADHRFLDGVVFF